MSQTQLASMYIGNPYTHDADSRLKGISSQLNATIHILDGQSNQGVILDYITAKNIISDLHKKSLEDTLETYQFITFADKRFSEFLEKRNRIIIPDEDGSLIEFVIFESAKYKDSEGYKTQVYAHASYLELKKASVIYPGTFTGTATQHGGRVLNDTGWQIGAIEGAGNKKISNDKHANPYEFLKRIAKDFDLELKFRVEHDGNKLIGRYVDLLERVGEWRGREVEFGKDLDGIRRVEKQDIVTALLGISPEDDEGNRLEVLEEDTEALERWGRVDEYGNLKHLIEHYEIQSERNEMNETEARQYTRTALNKRINTNVTFEATIIDLENVPGMENKKIRFGDTIRIKDTKFNPPLYLEARIFEQDRSIKSKAKIDFKLGDFVEFTEEEVNAVFIQLQNEIRKRVSIDQLKEYAEPKKIESDIAPVIKQGENPIWVDTSKTPKVPYVVIAGQWQKMSPTTPAEVDAYTKLQVDSKDGGTLASAKTDATDKANAAQLAAEAVAVAKAGLAETQAKAYADGIVSDEEARAIADAQAKLTLAKADAKTKADAAEVAANAHTVDYTYNKGSIDGKDNTIDSNAQSYASTAKSEALADAKAFSKNADNITSGVIDVSAIPLRTSITGARLEWDGVNGLVQYNQNGDPVSWIDLDANAHFSNGNFSGTVTSSVIETTKTVGSRVQNARFNGDEFRFVRFKDGVIDPNTVTLDTSEVDNVTRIFYDGVAFATDSGAAGFGIQGIHHSGMLNFYVDAMSVDAPNGTTFMNNVDIWRDLNVDGQLTAADSSVWLAGNGRINATSTRTYIQNNGEVWNTKVQSFTTVNSIAKSFNVVSQEHLKTDIKPIEYDALTILKNSDLYHFKFKADVEEGIDDVVKHGFIIGDGYRTPKEVMGENGITIDGYSHSTLNSKAIQELIKRIEKLEAK